MFKNIVQLKLRFFAKAILAKYKPKVVGITGSVGKTSTKEAVYAVLRGRFNVRKSLKNYNNEIGLPLTIIGSYSAGSNIFGWIKILLKALFLLLIKDKNYPEILILEMGVDRPGDMDYLLDIVKPDVGMITMVGPTHLETFGKIENIRQEKGKLMKGIKKGGLAVFNADNEECLKIKNECDSKIITYGFGKQADVWGNELKFKYKDLKSVNGLSGITFKLNFKGSTVPVVLPKSIGRPAVNSSLAAVCVGFFFKMNLIDMANALEVFEAPNGRMKIIKGIKKTLIIDDTYNASPQSSLAAIDFLKNVNVREKFKKIAVFGDMLELGSESVKGHKQVGQALAEADFDMVVAVGERARDILRGARETGMKDSHLFHFDRNREAGKFVQKKMKSGDLVLIKGSQGARMEQVVKEIMADPMNFKELLVRQEDDWLEK